jgi:hypothetical protein
MRRLLLILIITLSFQTWAKADDISDLEIEGMSIGDSLLDFYSEDQIISKSKYILSGGKIYYEWNQIYKENNNELYDRIALYFKADDKNYIIKKISGRNYYINNIENCYDTQIIIKNEIKKIIPNIKKTDLKKVKVPAFPKGKSYQTTVFFTFTDGSYVGIWCLDYSKKDTNSRDRLSVVFATDEYQTWQHSKDRK